MRHILVIGAGVVGLASAIRLLEQGHTVTLLDRRGPGEGASRGNAAGIAWTDVAPLASPGIWRDVPGWLFDPLGPLSVRPAYALQILPWMVRFCLAALPSKVAQSTQAKAALNGASLQAWQRLWQRTGTAHRVRYSGCLDVYDDDKQIARARPGWQQQRDFGIEVEELSGAELRELEPDLSQRVKGGARLPGWTSVDEPFLLCQDLAAFFQGQGGTIRTAAVAAVQPSGTGVSVSLEDGEHIEGDHAVITAGAWSKALASRLGDPVPLDTERGYNTTIADSGVALRHMVMLPGYGFALSQLATGLRVGGAVEFGGLKLPPNWKRAEALLKRAKTILPGLQTEGGKQWMGFRPSLPDTLPVIGPSTASPHITYAFGHGHHGLTQAAITADLVVALVTGERPALSLEPYSAQRF
ncbi:FAD-binding oxidoreductase [Pseudovibrio sp. SPO723]|uniref:NAD(P)/FAD-dependent oxidoreductase n=1 Tax=Nesiotobacter zosterae TaxID=392721 RepID=UPI0029C28B3D|nr:FAD-binding oxidoreductase [Pseudovibrio sp. SPO723]MDX5595376.1 FAD-binding oxidoreductase [Pseudovibrio sp. SPO723]